MSEAKSSQCRTELLEDRPSDQDELSNGSRVGPHSRLASGIAGLILGNGRGVLLSIEGHYGSGKSTVVGLLAKQLKPSLEAKVFVFDAWSHSGDPLRLVFLTALVDQLSRDEWLSEGEGDQNWKRRLGVLSKRIKESETVTTPKPTSFGVRIAMALALVPIGLAFIQAGLRAGLTFESGGTLAWEFILGVALSLGPIVLAKRQLSKSKDNAEALAVLGGTKETRTSTMESVSPEPTTVQFESIFSEIVEQALPIGGKKKLVIVFDNLDRLSEEVAAQAWATLQVFTRIQNSIVAASALWVIVPFDPRSMSPLTGAPRDRATADQLLDKTFAARFELPLPVASDWRTFLKNSLSSAFPDHPGQEVEVVCQIFNEMRAGLSQGPREIKAFVNQMGSIHRQWPCDEIPLVTIAYFVALKRFRTDHEILEQIRKREIPANVEWLIGGPSALRNVAALAFNVDAKTAEQILLTDPAVIALTSGNGEAFDALVDDAGSGFWAVVPTLLARMATVADVEVAPMVIAATNSRNLESRDSDVIHVLRSIGRRASAVDSWANPSDALGEALGSLAARTENSSLVGAFQASIQATFSSANSTLEGWEEACISMAIAYDRVLGEFGQPRKFAHGITAERWLRNVSVGSLVRQFPHLFSPWISADKLLEFVSQKLVPGVPKAIVDAVVELDVSRIDANGFLEVVWTGMLSEDKSLRDACVDIAIIFDAKGVRWVASNSAPKIQKALISVWNSVPRLPTGERAVAAMVLTIAEFEKFKGAVAGPIAVNAQSRCDAFLSSPNEQDAQILADRLHVFRMTDRFLHLLGHKDGQLLRRTFVHLLSIEGGGAINASQLASCWDRISKIVTVADLVPFFKTLPPQEARELLLTESRDVTRLLLFAAGLTVFPELANEVSDSIGKFSNIDWREVLVSEPLRSAALLISRNVNGLSVGANGALSMADALYDIVTDSALAARAGGGLLRDFGAALPGATLDDLIRRIVVHLTANPIRAKAVMAELDSVPSAARIVAGSAVTSNLFRSIVESGDADLLAWFVGLFEAEVDAVGEFRDGLRQRALAALESADIDPERKTLLSRLVSALARAPIG